MSNFTQNENSFIDFNYLLNKCLHEQDNYPNMSVHKTLIILTITTGLEMEFIMTLKWKDVLIHGSDNDTEAKKDLDELKVRKYLIPIHPKVGFLLSQIHDKLFYPKLDSKILDSHGLDQDLLLNSPSSFAKKVISNFIPNILGEKRLDNKLVDEINIDTYTRVVFGKRVLEVNGYSNEVSKQLKNHFRFKTNKELFNFLGYSSQEEIKYNLSNINFSNNAKVRFDGNADDIIYCHEFIKLQDKNFYGGYPFQKFSAFSKFLISKYDETTYQDTIGNSIWILLLMSLYNGVRISKLLDLKWKDILKESKTKDDFEILSICNLDGYNIKIEEVVKQNLMNHFQPRKKKIFTAGSFRFVSYELDSKTIPKLDSPVFITNTGNALTQNSLSREIKGVLNRWNFPHTDKFTSKTPLIIWGRRIIEIRGDHKPTIKALKEHFNFKSHDELFKFLSIDYYKEVRGKQRNILFEEILYDL